MIKGIWVIFYKKLKGCRILEGPGRIFRDIRIQILVIFAKI